jgi:hypothetical protein
MNFCSTNWPLALPKLHSINRWTDSDKYCAKLITNLNSSMILYSMLVDRLVT